MMPRDHFPESSRAHFHCVGDSIPTKTGRAALFLVPSVAVVFIGQAGRELLPPDDLREAEVAREMVVTRDYVVPHLAGLQFVEKPPGFQVMIAVAYRLAGGPNAFAARAVSIMFALAGLLAIFLLGRRMAGIESGGLAVACLALSFRFCQTAHEVLLDNALTALLAFALLFAWLALDADTPQTKQLAYAATAFTLGLAFLVKGLVGPVLFGSGFLPYVLLARRSGELRSALGSWPIAVFLSTVLLWVDVICGRPPPARRLSSHSGGRCFSPAG